MKKKYRIFFLEPNYATTERPGFDEFMEPINLCYIAAAAKNDGHEVIVKQQFNKSTSEIVNEIIEFDAEILAFTVVTCFFNNAKKILSKVKSKKPKIISVAGGAHVSGDPKESAQFFDYVFVGEGESSFVKFLEELPRDRTPNIPGLGYSISNDFYFNAERTRDKNFPFLPYRDSLDMNIYTGIGNGPPPIPKTNFATMLMSKGCKHNCTFCLNQVIWKDSNLKGIPVVKRTATDVVNEMKLLKSKYDVGYLWFHDPDFPIYDRQYMSLFFEEKKKIADIKYAFMTRIDNVSGKISTEETKVFLEELKKSGCHMIGFGIESFAPEILKEMKKQVSFQKVKQTIELVFNAGIIPVGFFIIGYPSDTKETLETTYRMARQLKIIRYRFSIYYPFKGIPDRKSIANIQWILPEEETYDFADNEHQMVKCNVPEKIFKNYFRKFNTGIYSEPEYKANLNEFYNMHPDMQETIDSWKQMIINL